MNQTASLLVKQTALAEAQYDGRLPKVGIGLGVYLIDRTDVSTSRLALSKASNTQTSMATCHSVSPLSLSNPLPLSGCNGRIH